MAGTNANGKGGLTVNAPTSGTGSPTPTNYRSFQDDNHTRDGDPGNAHTDSSGGHRSLVARRGGPPRTSPHAHVADDSHRGFSTSIHDAYRATEHERVDCCSFTCCGVLQSDRDRYLLQGVTPPGVGHRVVVHVLLPLTILGAAGYGAMHIANVRINQMYCTVLVFTMLFYVLALCYKGRSKRIEVRKDLLWTKYQISESSQNTDLAVLWEQERPEDEEEARDLSTYYLGQSRRDFSSAHPCCLVGCYPEDRNLNREVASSLEHNLCGALWDFFCFPICGMHVQLCGMCALAQEAREVEQVLLPPSYRRIDYITMQAYADYYPAIYLDKWAEAPLRRSWSRIPPLSRLSIRLLQAALIVAALLLVWALVANLYWHKIYRTNNKSHVFNLADYGIFIATVMQSGGLLMILVFFTNLPKKSELSLDALVKYFASGFVLSVTLAVFWEMVIGLALKTFVAFILIVAGVDVVDDPGSNGTYTFGIGFGPSLLSNTSRHLAAEADPRNFLDVFGNEHPVFYTMMLMLEAFLMAAFVEELCKYFGYRMVEHPDFLTKDDLDQAMSVAHDEPSEEVEDGHPRQHRECQDYSFQRKSLQAQGAAITLAMIAVAIGFTCCENLVYIFVYSGESVKAELTVLIARSCFPVHPISAALQSLGVVRRDLEADRSRALGRIILPAVLLHGGYDFFIMWIDFLSRRHGVDADENPTALLVSLIVSVSAMLVALTWYFRESKLQRERLAAIDQISNVDRSRLL
jgi:RsiW-degrading membrane proteinase PrsW (M82 family)